MANCSNLLNVTKWNNESLREELKKAKEVVQGPGVCICAECIEDARTALRETNECR